MIVVTSGADKYWIGVRIPVRRRGDERTLPGTLLFASSSLLGNPFYFQPLPWLGAAAFTLVVTMLCWLPFVRGVTRSVSAMTAATAGVTPLVYGEMRLCRDQEHSTGGQKITF